MLAQTLGDRMKAYEAIPKTRLMKRTPVAIRIDGKAFHTFTKGFKRPYDRVLRNTMVRTMKALCQNMQGCIFGYTQSDEITLILEDYHDINTDAWFDYQVQKICSVSASMATMYFNKFFQEEIQLEILDYKSSLVPQSVELQEKWANYIDTLKAAAAKGAMFDARCFNIPKDEVVNLVYWRQQDAIRNSILLAGQYYFSHTELQGKKCPEILEMLKTQKYFNWELDTPIANQRGVCWTRKGGTNWAMPILKDNRNYLEDLVYMRGGETDG